MNLRKWVKCIALSTLDILALTSAVSIMSNHELYPTFINLMSWFVISICSYDIITKFVDSEKSKSLEEIAKIAGYTNVYTVISANEVSPDVAEESFKPERMRVVSKQLPFLRFIEYVNNLKVTTHLGTRSQTETYLAPKTKENIDIIHKIVGDNVFFSSATNYVEENIVQLDKIDLIDVSMIIEDVDRCMSGKYGMSYGSSEEVDDKYDISDYKVHMFEAESCQIYKFRLY